MTRIGYEHDCWKNFIPKIQTLIVTKKLILQNTKVSLYFLTTDDRFLHYQFKTTEGYIHCIQDCLAVDDSCVWSDVLDYQYSIKCRVRNYIAPWSTNEITKCRLYHKQLLIDDDFKFIHKSTVNQLIKTDHQFQMGNVYSLSSAIIDEIHNVIDELTRI